MLEMSILGPVSGDGTDRGTHYLFDAIGLLPNARTLLFLSCE
jgi:hypothetical protein